jgi:hypothetical protein
MRACVAKPRRVVVPRTSPHTSIWDETYLQALVAAYEWSPKLSFSHSKEGSRSSRTWQLPVTRMAATFHTWVATQDALSA